MRINEKGRNEERGREREKRGGYIFIVLCIVGDILSAMNLLKL